MSTWSNMAEMITNPTEQQRGRLDRGRPGAARSMTSAPVWLGEGSVWTSVLAGEEAVLVETSAPAGYRARHRASADRRGRSSRAYPFQRVRSLDDGFDQAGDDVVHVSGDGHTGRDRIGGAQYLDVARHAAGRVDDRALAKGGLVHADPLGVAVAKVVVGECGRSALGVVDDGDLEEWAVRYDVRGELSGEGDVVDYFRGDAPADVADDDRVAEVEAEDVGGVDAGVEAGEHEHAQGGEDGGALVAAGGGEGAIAVEGFVHDWSSFGSGAVQSPAGTAAI